MPPNGQGPTINDVTSMATVLSRILSHLVSFTGINDLSAKAKILEIKNIEC
jgi:hypothetical protein